MIQNLDILIETEVRQFNLMRHHKLADPTFIPLHLTGGIGDVIMSIDSVIFLKSLFQIVVYTKHVEAFKYFCKEDIPVINQLPSFTWVLEFNTLAKFVFSDQFHGFLNKEHEELFLQQQRIFSEHPRLETLVKINSEKFFLISILGKELRKDRRQFPLLSLGYDQCPI